MMSFARSIRPAWRPSTAASLAMAIVLGAQFVPTASTMATVLAGTAGYDYYAGPGGQTTRSFSGTGAADFGTVRSSLGLVRFDDSQVGEGVSVMGSLGASLGASTWLQTMISRYIGDSNYRAWRLRLGPSFELPGAHSLGIYLSHYSDDSSNTSNGLAAEFGARLRENVVGRVTGSYARAKGQGSGQAAVGLNWTLVHHLEFEGDVGAGQSGAGANGAFPSKKAKHNASTETASNPVSLTGELAVRVTFP